jgi:hypothetical protein
MMMKKWLLSKIRYPVVAALLIYKGSTDGWTMSKFHELCDRMGPTLTVMKTIGGAICGGFTMQDWTSGDGYKYDSCAFVFRLDTKATYSPKLQSGKAIYCNSGKGPCFGRYALSLWDDPMNGSGNGGCDVENDECDPYYKIEADENGNSPLTGEGADEDNEKSFTCVELEVY